MSGVFGQRFGRRKGDHARSCSTNSTSSPLVFFHVKYVYDCENPAFASSVVSAGRVKASDRKTVPGCRLRTSAMSHSQNGIGFVWGLSTRKAVTPASHHPSTTSRIAFQSAFRSRVCQSRLWMSW